MVITRTSSQLCCHVRHIFSPSAKVAASELGRMKLASERKMTEVSATLRTISAEAQTQTQEPTAAAQKCKAS